ncbi:MAG: DUF2460 domain-containing protein [Methylobacterium frigidaeris]
MKVAPPAGAALTAGFRFDVPVRFATDRIEIDHQAVQAGLVADIPVIELRRGLDPRRFHTSTFSHGPVRGTVALRA